MTGFFHIPSAFGVLEERVIPALFEGKSLKDPIRVWVAGCATGEEAYSVAILLFQYASTLKAPPKIEIFATDNDKKALEHAKIGVYPSTIENDMSQYCLTKYFALSPDGYAVVPEVKDAVLFSSHDVLIDNSFQSFDLITCRHLLGYLDQSSQAQIITFFHHSLKPDGFLFLGDSEFAEGLPHQFKGINETHKIYQLSSEGNAPELETVEEEEYIEVEDVQPNNEEAELNEETQEVVLESAVEPHPPVEVDPEIYMDVNGGDNQPAAPRTYVITEEGNTNGLFAEKTAGKEDVAAVDSEYAPPMSPVQDGEHEITPDEMTPQLLAVSNERNTATIEQVEYTHEERQEHEITVQPYSNYFRKALLDKYAPPSVIIDKYFNILEYTEQITKVFVPAQRNLIRDYLDGLPDYDRLRIEEAIHEAFAEESTEDKTELRLGNSTGDGAGYVAKLIYHPGDGDGSGYVQLVFEAPERKVVNPPVPEKAKVPLFGTRHSEESNGQASTHSAEEVKQKQPPTIEQSYLSVISTAPYPILVHAEGGKIVASSPAWYYMAGVNREEAPTISEWIRKVRGQRLSLKNSSLKEAYKEKGVVCISIRTTEGDTKLLAFHSYFLGRDSHGRKLTLTMAVDITTYPGHSGVGITPEIADFGMATKKAFLANISHEIRTPLTSMIGFADYLSDKLTGQDVQFAQYISESGNRLLETLNAVLRVASMGSLEQSLKPEMIDLTVEVQGVLELYKPQAEQYGIPLKMVVEQPARATLDRASFRRVMANLIGNAVKFTSDGEVVVNVGSDDTAVIVSVEDTGVGISAEFLPFIFDRFSQESKGQARSNSGCGLGLAIARSLVEAMGGGMQVESEVGVGSKFTVHLPRQSKMAVVQMEEEVANAEEKQREEWDKARILVVEDNVDTQELMMLILQDTYSVAMTSNATETLQVAKKQRFDVVLMDLNLGGKRTGFELLRELRKMKDYENTPVLAVSALPIGVVRKQLIREGFNGYIAKPFTRARIMDALEGLVEGPES